MSLKPDPDSPLWPSLAIVVAAVLWGLYWLPMRGMAEMGVEGAWPSLLLNAAVVALLLPPALMRWRRFLIDPLDLAVSGLLIGAALSLYGISLNLTDVVRAVLLFYLMPLWGAAIGVIWLGERLTARRGAALIFGFAGLMVVLEADAGLPLPQNTGDWMALFSGMAWAVGSTRIFVGKKHATFEVALVFALGTVVVTGLLILLFPPGALGLQPTAAAVADSAAVLAAGAFLLMIPIFFLTVWGAKRLSPTTVGILLLGDVVVAVVSAAILIETEPFGTREVIGTALILAAGVMEVLPRRRVRSA
jgi:drug/metabolite transporter (DMT)-like permease